jgi:hypothetical protein
MICDIELAAKLWQRILRTESGKLFGQYSGRLLKPRHEGDGLERSRATSEPTTGGLCSSR